MKGSGIRSDALLRPSRRIGAAPVMFLLFMSLAPSAKPVHALGAAADELMIQERPHGVPGDEALEGENAVIGEIEIVNLDIFNTSDPRENNLIYRTANRLHLNTRERVIRRQLLFREGDRYSGRLLAESERLLRSCNYIYDARVIPIRYVDGRVDVRVTTRDVWTLHAGLGFGRKGGKNVTRIGVQDSNFLGLGKDVTVQRTEDVDRTSQLYRYRDANLGGGRARLELRYLDNSDGYMRYLDLGRPFYALDSKWSAGVQFFDFDRVDHLYSLGEIREEFRHVGRFLEVQGGWSQGIADRSAERWQVGFTHERHRFFPVEGAEILSGLPADRTLAYPWIEFAHLEERFARLRNLDRIQRTEDLNFGTDFRVRLGWSWRPLGAERSQAVLLCAVDGGYSAGTSGILLTRLRASGRLGNGGGENLLVEGSLRYFLATFGGQQFYVQVEAAAAGRLDPEVQLLLGGDSGMRGYPLRYQEGDRRFLVTVEQRFYTDWYILRLARVGAAAFFDIGRAWFAGQRGNEAELGLLKDVGFGLRLESTRAARSSMLHVDVAFPLDGEDSIKSVQLLVSTKERF